MLRESNDTRVVVDNAIGFAKTKKKGTWEEIFDNSKLNPKKWEDEPIEEENLNNHKRKTPSNC